MTNSRAMFQRLLIAVAIVLLESTSNWLHATTRNWNTGDGNWNVPTNWTPAGVPGTGDVVSIGFADGVARTVNYDYVGPLTVLGSLGLDLTGTGSDAATLTISAANNLSSNVDYVGYNGRGAVVQSAGQSTVATGLYLGYNAGANGSYSVSGTGVLAVAGDQFIGNAGTGMLTIDSGGYVSNAGGNVGELSGASGSANIDGPGSKWINNGVLAVGKFGTGAMNVANGGFVSSVNGRIGRETGATGTVTLDGPSSKWQMTGDLTVGSVTGTGTGTLTIQNDAFVHVGNNFAINNVSTVNLNGGTLRFNTASGLDRLNFTSGTIQLAGDRYISSFSLFTTLFPGSLITIPSGKGLTIEGNAALATWCTVRGRFTSPTLDMTNANEMLIIDSGGTANTGYTAIGSTFAANLDCSVTVTGAGSTWTAIEADVGYENPGTGTVTIANQAFADIRSLALGHNGQITLDGGTLRLDQWYRESLAAPGKLNFNAGTLQMRNNRSLAIDPAIKEFFGAAIDLPEGKGLTIEGTATIDTPITIDGGTFSAGQLAGAPLGESLRRGTLNVTNQAVTIGPGGPFGSQLDVDDSVTVNVTLGLTNYGLVTGDGQLGGTFDNAAGGELRAQSGRSLALTGAGNSNAGQIKLLGGELAFTQDLTNNAGALISGNGSLITGGGLANFGTMNFAGTANIVGPVNNAAGGKIISGGGGATIFYDDVTNNGEIRTSTNGFSVFFGSVSGSGSFTGTGTVNFEGDLSPGSSPALVNFAGDVGLGADATLRIELGGTNAGSQYDRMNVAGEVALDGTLEVSLINGFVPSAGQSFDFLNAGSVSGAFTNIILPAGFSWDISQLSAGIISVVSASLPGDFNHDGKVDAADYVVWRKSINTGAAYNEWRSNFGASAGGGAVATAGFAGRAVPEPAGSSWLALVVISATLATARRHITMPHARIRADFSSLHAPQREPGYCSN